MLDYQISTHETIVNAKGVAAGQSIAALALQSSLGMAL